MPPRIRTVQQNLQRANLILVALQIFPELLRGIPNALRIRRRKLKQLVLGDLYRPDGTYAYAGGWNWRAVIATVIGCAFAWIGLVVPSLRPLYDYAWFVGFFAAGAAHVALARRSASTIPAGAAQRVES